jgi:NitT/TauT family transport system ATP-binding protein
MSKIYLDTAGLFAWTVTIVLVSFLFEKAVLSVFRLFAGWHPYPFFGWREWYQGNLFSDVDKKSRWKEAGIQQQERIHTQNSIQMLHIEKSYNGQSVIRDFNLKMERGGRYLLMAPSGAGKTTLLKILTGLEQADRGEIAGMAGRIGMVFQEDRLCEEYDAVCNILLGMEKSRNLLMKSCGSDSMTRKQFQRQLIEYVRAQAVRILPEDCLTKPVGNLSGGMSRRVSLLRAVLSGADILIMDEPFTGLDEENRARSAAYLMEQLQGRTLLATTHREEDVDLLRGKKIYC